MNYENIKLYRAWDKLTDEYAVYIADADTGADWADFTDSLAFGDRVYVISTKKMYMKGANQLYEMPIVF